MNAATSPDHAQALARAARQADVVRALGAVLPAANVGLAATAAPAGKGLHPVFDGYTLTGDANIVQARLTLRYAAAPRSRRRLRL